MPDQVSKPPRTAIALNDEAKILMCCLGLGGLIFGTLAIFRTEVEAGPVALLILGALFVIVALAGELPTRLKVGDNEAEWAAQREVGELLAQTIGSTPNSERDAQIAELEQIAERAPIAAAPALRAIAFEQSVVHLLEKLQADGRSSGFEISTHFFGDRIRRATIRHLPTRDTPKVVVIEVRYRLETWSLFWRKIMAARSENNLPLMRVADPLDIFVLLVVRELDADMSGATGNHQVDGGDWVQYDGSEEAFERFMSTLIGLLRA